MSVDASTQQQPSIADQQRAILGHAAGYASHRAIAMGLRTGLLDALADSPDGATADELADRLGFDPFYVSVWARAALAAGVCERAGDGYRLAPHVDRLLLDPDAPTHIGSIFPLFEQPELFDRFEEVLPSGERMWWDDCSPEWIKGVSRTGAPAYVRMVSAGLPEVPGLDERLAEGGVIVDTACGSGYGLVRLAEAYPQCQLVGIDGDAKSIELADRRIEEAGLRQRASLQLSPLEELELERPATLITNNLSMHECRDIDQVTRRVKESLEPGGWFVISDFPFPDSDDQLRSVPGRLMAGIQFFEAQIDDQLLPRAAYDELLERHGFSDLGSTQLAPVHALTWGRA